MNPTFEALVDAHVSAHPDVQAEWRHVRSLFRGERLELRCSRPGAFTVCAIVRPRSITLGIIGAMVYPGNYRFGQELSDEQRAAEAFAALCGLLERWHPPE